LNFTDLGLHPDLLDGIDALNYTTATPIQEQAIPIILAGKDLIGVAQTGTGKTAAFILPIIHQILESNEADFTQALVIVPTRELAMQIDQVVEAYSYFTGVSSIAIFGGSDGKAFAREKQAITGGVDIIIATPGRLLAHMKLGYVDFSRMRHLVLDEADRMLDMGFMPDLQKIISTLNPHRQSLLFSATMPPQVLKLAKSLLKNPEQITIALSKPAEGVTQAVYMVADSHKNALITHLLRDKTGQRIIVFGSTKQSVSNLYYKLAQKKLPVAQISSDLEQEEREKVMQDFRNRKVEILVATDVLSRGIDVESIDMVINFDVPRDPEDYVHRIGRTARAAKKGAALTLVSPKDLPRFKRIEKLIGRSVEQLELPAGMQQGNAESGRNTDKKPQDRRKKTQSKDQPRQPRPEKPAPKPPTTNEASPAPENQEQKKRKKRRRNHRRRNSQSGEGQPANPPVQDNIISTAT
jgi:ATP-dependent RNA helicase RhlE